MLKSIYYHPWFPRLFFIKYDGGLDSGVTGYFLIEWKRVFSVGLLHFKNGTRPAYHSHAFNAISWFLSGTVTEEKLNGESKDFRPSIKPKFTPKSNCHRVISYGDTYALTFRGPWDDTWQEYRPNKVVVTLTHGRKEVDIQ